MTESVVTEVKSWRASDGRIFKRRYEAEEHEAHIKLERLLEDNGVCKGGEWSQDMIRDFILENCYQIGRIFEFKYDEHGDSPPRRGA